MSTDKITDDKAAARRRGEQRAEKEALRKLSASEAMSAQKAVRDAELAKTKRLRALRLAKEVEESAASSGQTKPKAAKAKRGTGS
jgi:hypothetical protein